MPSRLAISSAESPEARRKAFRRLPMSSKRTGMTSCRVEQTACRGLGVLPPPLWGRVGERGSNRLGVCGYPPPCPSPTRGEGTLWPEPLQHRGCARLVTSMAVLHGRGRQALQALGGVERGGNDALVAGAAAEVAGDGDTHLLLGRIGIIAQEFGERCEHAGRAEAALQAVIVAERLLQRIELVGPGREPFDRGELV